MAEHRPLEDVRVLEWTASAAGQAAGMLLADLGADVVRVVPGDDVEATGMPGWLCWNRGKTLVDPDAGADALIDRADVLVHDAAPAAARSAAELRERAPGLVSVWMPALAVPYRGHELANRQLLLDGISGFADNHPAVEPRPVASVVPTRHLVQGALGSVAAVAGLLARRRDGWGRAATVTGLHAEAAALATLVNETVEGRAKVAPPRSVDGVPYFRLYRAGDGRWFYLAALSPELFIRALDAMDRLDLFAHPGVDGEFANFVLPGVVDEVGAEIEKTLASQPAELWMRRFADADVPAALLTDPGDWLRGDVVAHACPPVSRAHPEVGEVVLPGVPVGFSADSVCAGELPRSDLRHDPAAVWVDAEPLPAPTGSPPGEGDRPLAGLRVVDTASFLAAPFVSTLLAAHGADVVKVEPPSGDPYAGFTTSYGIVNEHKPRLRLDLRDDGDRDEFLALVGAADVVVDNLLASSLGRIGLGPERFEQANPALVRCSVTAYGTTGPFAELPGFDPVVQTLSGLAAVQGGDGRPVVATAPVHDVGTGCVGALGVLAALWSRERTGRGQRVFTSLAATSTYLQSAELTDYEGRPARPLGGEDFPGPSSWERFYEAADGWIAVAATTPERRRALLEALGCPQLMGASDPERAVEVERRTARERGDVLVDRLLSHGVPSCLVVERGRELDDPFLVDQDFSHVVETANVGLIRAAGGYTDWVGTARRAPLPAEALATDVGAVRSHWARPSA